jgi:hypothetical protein
MVHYYTQSLAERNGQARGRGGGLPAATVRLLRLVGRDDLGRRVEETADPHRHSVRAAPGLRADPVVAPPEAGRRDPGRNRPIAPFQGLLLGLFFMAVGMSTNLSLLVKFPWQILGLTLGLVVIKFVTLYALRRLIGGRKADARPLALALAQGGEFAFVLFDAAQSFRVLGEVQADKLTLVVALSMALSPLLLMLGDSLARAEAEAQPPRAFDTMPAEAGEVVIAGFGRVGQIVGRLLLARGYKIRH